MKWVSEIALFLIIGGTFSSIDKYSKGKKGLQNIIGNENGLTIQDTLHSWDKIEVKDNKFKVEIGDSDYSYHYQHYNDGLKEYIEENKSRVTLEKFEREA